MLRDISSSCRWLEDPDAPDTIACRFLRCPACLKCSSQSRITEQDMKQHVCDIMFARLAKASKNVATLCAVVEAQNKLTEQVLEQCQTRAQFKKLLTSIFDYPRYSCPFKRGDR